jgi:hypothetical protein
VAQADDDLTELERAVALVPRISDHADDALAQP